MKYKSFVMFRSCLVVWHLSLSTVELNSPISKKTCHKMLMFKQIPCGGYGFVYSL